MLFGFLIKKPIFSNESLFVIYDYYFITYFCYYPIFKNYFKGFKHLPQIKKKTFEASMSKVKTMFSMYFSFLSPIITFFILKLLI